jgi:phosphatidylglycerophosphatase A
VSLGWALAGFVLFRFFDIIKPWPIRWVDQRVGGGFGIMLDDVLAAVYAGAILHLVWYFWG